LVIKIASTDETFDTSEEGYAKMGCCFSKSDNDVKTPEPSGKKVYSWDTDSRPDPADYRFTNVENEVLIKPEGSIDGQQFIIQNCKSCTIFLFDHSDSITIEDCVDCKFIIGPVQGSIFFRNCDESLCLISCQQFRIRDCQKLDVHLYCTTQPVIETSANIRFSCLQLSYGSLEDHFTKSNLNIYNNNWSSIHDFSPSMDRNNWTLNTTDVSALQGIIAAENSYPESVTSDPNYQSLSFDTLTSVVPLTTGQMPKEHISSTFVIIFNHPAMKTAAREFVSDINTTSIDIIQSKEMTLNDQEAERLFDDLEDAAVYFTSAKRGAVLTFELNGDDCINRTKQAVKSLTSPERPLIYCSQDEERAACDVAEISQIYDTRRSAF